MLAKKDSLLQIEEIVRIYANSKYLDKNVRWVLFILAEYIYSAYASWFSHLCRYNLSTESADQLIAESAKPFTILSIL